jgi:hypothetical protein
VGRIELAGRVRHLEGRCPDITFRLDGWQVYADASTEYRRSRCGDVESRSEVEVNGERYSDGRVKAERIQVRSRRGDDDDDDDDDDGSD